MGVVSLCLISEGVWLEGVAAKPMSSSWFFQLSQIRCIFKELAAEGSQWIPTSHGPGPAISAEPAVVESFQSKCSSNYNTSIWGSMPASFHVPIPLGFTLWAQAAGGFANGNFSRSSCTIPAAVFSPVWEITELEWSCYTLSLSVKMLSNQQRTGDQREQFQFVLWSLF